MSLLLLFSAVFILALGVALYNRLSTRTDRCTQCGRRRVRGQQTCPFCGTSYSTTSTTVQDGKTPPPSSSPYLKIVSGDPSHGKEIPIVASQFTIGRHPSSHFHIEGNLISRRHAQIVREGNAWVLYDLESANGTFLNGQRIARSRLQHGDRITVGPCEMVFMEPGGEGVRLEVSRTPQPEPSPSTAIRSRPPSTKAFDLRLFHLEKVHVSDMAEVYKGVRESDGLTVAIKILRSTDPYVRDKFWHTEGQIGEVLNHPNIVKIHGRGQDESGRLFIVMEWLGGGTLRDRLQRQDGRHPDLDWVVVVIGQVCEGLSYAHRQGVVHRDIKPENIMFSENNRSVKIVDFGIARLTEQRTQTSMGMILGTPLYMSPEQARGERADSRSDIYAVGAILYELLAGRPPFTGDPLTVAHKHITEEPVLPRALNPAIPPHIEAAIVKALQKDPRKRFRDTRELAAAIGYKGTPVVSTPRPAIAERPKVTPRPSSSQTSACLRILNGPYRNRVIPLPQGSAVLLSRLSVNPQDPQISRRHARIVSLGEQFWIQDERSTNGTFHNRFRVETRALLSPGDEIRLGQTILRVER